MEKKEPIMDAAQEAVMDEKELQREQQDYAMLKLRITS